MYCNTLRYRSPCAEQMLGHDVLRKGGEFGYSWIKGEIWVSRWRGCPALNEMIAGLWLYAMYGEVLLLLWMNKSTMYSTPRSQQELDSLQGLPSQNTIWLYNLFHFDLLFHILKCYFWQCGSFASLDIVLIRKKNKSFPVLFCLIIDRTLFMFHQ